LGDEVVDELAHGRGGQAGLGGDVGEAQAVVDGEHLQRVAVGGTQPGAGGLGDVPVDGGGQGVVGGAQQGGGGRAGVGCGHDLTPYEGYLIIRIPSQCTTRGRKSGTTAAPSSPTRSPPCDTPHSSSPGSA